MNNLYSNPLVGLDSLENELEKRIYRRQAILEGMSNRQQAVELSLNQAQMESIELFDEEDLSLDTLQKQLAALGTLRKIQKGRTEAIQDAKEAKNRMEEVKQQLDTSARQAILLSNIQRADEALKNLDLNRLTGLLQNRNELLSDDTPAYIRDWLDRLQIDLNMLVSLYSGQQSPDLQDLKAYHRQLAEEQPLDSEQRRVLRDLSATYPDSMLLAHFRQLDLYYRQSSSDYAAISASAEELDALDQELVSLAEAFLSGSEWDKVNTLFRRLKNRFTASVGGKAESNILSDWFFNMWRRWIEQARHLESDLKDIERALSVPQTSQRQLTPRIVTLVTRIEKTDDVAFCPFADKWELIVSKLPEGVGINKPNLSSMGRTMRDRGGKFLAHLLPTVRLKPSITTGDTVAGLRSTSMAPPAQGPQTRHAGWEPPVRSTGGRS